MIERKGNKHYIHSAGLFKTPETGEELQAMTNNTNDPPGAMRIIMHTLNFVAKLAKEAPIFNEEPGVHYPFWVQITEDECELLQEIVNEEIALLKGERNKNRKTIKSIEILESFYSKIS